MASHGKHKKRAARGSISRLGRSRVSQKISHLMEKENMPQKQAVATALSMERAGRLTKGGGYKRVVR